MTTMTSTERRWSASPSRPESIRFPDFDAFNAPHSRDHPVIREEGSRRNIDKRSPPNPSGWGSTNGSMHIERWTPRRESGHGWGNGTTNEGRGHAHSHGRQKSLSDAIKTIRTRQGSVSANAQEIADALKAPVSYKLIGLCLIWYFSSALTNTSSKSILNAFPKPITLTIVQFGFVSLWCWVFANLAWVFPQLRATVPALRHGLRSPTRDVITTTLPLALFQLGGHVLSSTATQKIPVSLVHTIKGLSPLFTVLAYRLVFKVHYSTSTYLSLIPLTAGVILACSVEFSGNIYGILCAFVAAIIFVSQNIFSKKLFNDAARAEADNFPSSQTHSKKLDKLNLLFYCSSVAFLLTLPLWIWTDGLDLLGDVYAFGSVPLSNKPHALDHGPLALEFIFNGVFHFGQNIIAFVILSMVSPVTYSVASLIKRVFVIVIAILWFRSSTTPVQAFGIALTFLGLYLYDRTHDSARSAKHIHKSHGPPLLPLTTNDRRSSTAIFETPISMNPRQPYGISKGLSNGEDKRSDVNGHSRPRGTSRAEWLPPGTKQEETWRLHDTSAS